MKTTVASIMAPADLRLLKRLEAIKTTKCGLL